MFAGNVGAAQNLYVVLKAAKSVQQEEISDNGKKICFHIIGDGQELDNLKNMHKTTEFKMYYFMEENRLKKCRDIMRLQTL